jgi:hypothetical protein
MLVGPWLVMVDLFNFSQKVIEMVGSRARWGDNPWML